MYGGASTAALMAYQEHKTVGEWGSKSSDYLLEECNKKFSADPKVQEDLSKMVIACRATLVSELGTEKYKEMSAGTPTGDLANFYVMPIASIIAGMFTKNPLLKMLLIGFGGANLLNKAGHEALERRDGGQSQTVRQYPQYSDEDLDSRIKQPSMKGNTLIATIDNVPSVITINDEAADAYYKGAVPLNTLANAVLRKYDEQKETLEENYERQVAESNTEERSRGLK